MSALLLIRPFAVNDSSAVATVHVATWQQAYRGIIDDDILDALDVDSYTRRWQEGYERHKDNPAYGTLVAVTNNEIFGFLSYGPARDTNSTAQMEIYAINILKPYWGIGAGHELFTTACKKLKALRATHTYLWVLQDNLRAQQAYRRWGGSDAGNVTKSISIGGQPLLERRFDFRL